MYVPPLKHLCIHPTNDTLSFCKMINTAHGLLIDPTLPENILGADPRVACALLVGTNRKTAAWLIEPRKQVESDAEKESLRELLWDAVQRANEVAPDFARVDKVMILFTKPDKPMLRASKGTVQRKVTLEAYKEEIERLYGGSGSEVL